MSNKHGLVYAEGYDKKAIYDSGINEEHGEHTQNKTTETRISATLGNLRADGKHLVKGIQCHGQQIVRKWIEAEQRVERVIRNTVPEGESLAPGIVYVGVAMLAGPIFTRRRNVMVRWLSPWIFGSAAMSWFLPGTTAVVVRNIWGRYGDPTTIDRAKERWTELCNAQKRLQKDMADRVQQLRISLQEGRGFSTTLPTKIEEVIEEPNESHNAWDVAGEAAIPVLEAEAAVGEAVPKVLHEVNELEKKQESSEKNKLPLGFKDRVDN
ncbi:hypothetical protein COEREDRAFT_83801 [Coemansia reversa NRRL 1564]|uniref:MICOS complex subunit n=1 Tax=Coemansia reversa (strain ATCC 12441 / NRRL 1564) TaxID=763665 RepID=A0A2G5B1S9_COERN|nr:hypothetical protein COEREDRAFT_83801 [Coemansia reversa NRRL 1564]|eukprot:PIA12972.1 hypothetical protein COEREDRAFT_83801 [Coemansia reversa NRRL 1564]